jgi:acetate kinase
MGVIIDTRRNAEAIGKEAKISTDDSRVEVWTIPANEELLIARDTVRCLTGVPQPA